MQKRILKASLGIFLFVGILILLEGIFFYFLGMQYHFPYWIDNILFILLIAGLITLVVIVLHLYLLRRSSN